MRSDLWKQQIIRKSQRDGVLSGPFRGMKLSADDHWIPRLLGCYEKELHPAIEQLIAWNPHTILNAGAHTGYYAVGLALRLPQAQIVASEMDDTYALAMQDAIRANGVTTRVRMTDACSLEMMREVIDRPGAAVVCDIEGFEQVVVDPQAVPMLTQAALLIELHGPAVARVLIERLTPSHTLQPIAVQPRTRADLGKMPWYFAGADPSYLLQERQTEDCWVWAMPK